jgi:multisubunit Na+/H+ antiporter MnhE subunit
VAARNQLSGYLARWLLFIGVWFLFVFQLSLWEALAGAGAAGLTLFALEKACKYEPLRFQPRWHWLAQVGQLPKYIGNDLWVLIRAFARELAGKKSKASFQMVPFEASEDGPRAAAQRALVTLFATVPPNSVVVDFDRKQNYFMIHQLEKTSVPRLIRELET